MDGVGDKSRWHDYGTNVKQPANRPTMGAAGLPFSRQVEQVMAKTQEMSLDVRPLGKRSQPSVSAGSDFGDQECSPASKRTQHGISLRSEACDRFQHRVAPYTGAPDLALHRRVAAIQRPTGLPMTVLKPSQNVGKDIDVEIAVKGNDLPPASLPTSCCAGQFLESREAMCSEEKHLQRADGDGCFWKVCDDNLLSPAELQKQKWIFNKFAQLTKMTEPLLRLSEEHYDMEYQDEIQAGLYVVGPLQPGSWSPPCSNDGFDVDEFRNEPDLKIQVTMNGMVESFSVNVQCTQEVQRQLGSSQLSQAIEVFLDTLASKDDVVMNYGPGNDGMSLLQASLYWASASYAIRMHYFVLCVRNMYRIINRERSSGDVKGESEHGDDNGPEKKFKQQSLAALNRFFLAIEESERDTWAKAVAKFTAIAEDILSEDEWRSLHQLDLNDFCDRFRTCRFSKSYVRRLIKAKLEYAGVEISRYSAEHPVYQFALPIIPDFNGCSGGVEDDRIDGTIWLRVSLQAEQWHTALASETF